MVCGNTRELIGIITLELLARGSYLLYCSYAHCLSCRGAAPVREARAH